MAYEPFKERRIGIRRGPWKADDPCVRSPHRHLMGWGGFLIRPSMRGAAGGNYYQAFFLEKLMLLIRISM